MSKRDQITEYVLSSTRNMMPYDNGTSDKGLLDQNLTDLHIDSLEFMEFLMILEDRYNIRFKDAEIESISTANMMIDLICEKQNHE